MKKEWVKQDKKLFPLYLMFNSETKYFRLYMLFAISGVIAIVLLAEQYPAFMNWSTFLNGWLSFTFGIVFSLLQKHNPFNILFEEEKEEQENNKIMFWFGVILMVIGVILFIKALIK